MATPFWDNGELVPVEITTDDGDQVFFKAHLISRFLNRINKIRYENHSIGIEKTY
jgi:hypothetical protein